MWACALNICSPPKRPAWAKLAVQEASSGYGLAWSRATAIIETNKFCSGNHTSVLIWPRCSESSAGLSLILKPKILWRGTQASKKTFFFFLVTGQAKAFFSNAAVPVTINQAGIWASHFMNQQL